MKIRLVASCAGLFLASWLVFGQARHNPFEDRSDTGETVKVLPTPASIRSPHDTQPSDAPVHRGTSVYPASYGSGNLLYHNGRIMANPRYYAIYWNGAVANSTSTSLGYATISAQVASFAASFAKGTNWSNDPADDYEIVQQYNDSTGASPAATLPYDGTFVDGQSTKSSIKDSAIRTYLAGLFNGGKVPADANTIYGVYFPSGMRVSLTGGASCSSFCGYHSHFSYNGLQIKYAVFPYPDCSGCRLTGKTVADMLTIVGSHEIREAVTDPGDNNANAWYDSAGYEADDKCAWHNLYQMANGGFWVQPEYSNGIKIAPIGLPYPGPGCIVP